MDRDFDRNFRTMGTVMSANYLLAVVRSCPNVRSSEVYHGWNNLPRRSDRHHHVYSFFSRLALGQTTMNETGDTRSAPAAALDRSALPSPYIQWGPTVGGGLVAAAFFLFS